MTPDRYARRPMARRSLLKLGLAGAMAAGGLAGCSADTPAPSVSAGAKQPVKIQYWSHDSVLSLPLLQDLAKRLSAAPDAKYAYTIVPTILQPPDLVTKARAAFLAKSNPPDLLNIEVTAFSRFMPIAADTVVDLTKEVDAVRQQNLTNLTDPYSVEGVNYGVELSPALCTFYYRQDEFERLGIPETLDTWDDVLAAGARLATPQGKYLGQVVGEGSATGAAGSFLAYLIQRGGSVYDDQGAVALDTPEAVEVLTFLKRAVDEKVFLVLSGTAGGAQATVLKKSQVIGGLFPDYFEKFVLQQVVPEQKGKWRMSALPRFAAGGSNTSLLGGACFSVAKNSPVKDAALDLVRASILTEEGQVMKYRQANFKPTWLSVYEDPDVLAAKDPFMGGQEIGRVYAALAPETPKNYNSPKYSAALERLNASVLDAFNGKVSPAQAITEASTAIASIK